MSSWGAQESDADLLCLLPVACRPTMATQISKKRKFCADGVFKAELNEMLMRELAEDGCAPPPPSLTKPPRTKSPLRLFPFNHDRCGIVGCKTTAFCCDLARRCRADSGRYRLALGLVVTRWFEVVGAWKTPCLGGSSWAGPSAPHM